MADNFVLKKNNFISILENDTARTNQFYRWIRFRNHDSLVSFTITANVQLNTNILQFFRQRAIVASINGNLGVSLTIGGVTTRIFEDDLNEILGFLRITLWPFQLLINYWLSSEISMLLLKMDKLLTTSTRMHWLRNVIFSSRS